MFQAIRREFDKSKSLDRSRKVDLALPYPNRGESAIATDSQRAECEVLEMDGNQGWEAWNDSVFVQDFSDSVLDTIPGAL